MIDRDPHHAEWPSESRFPKDRVLGEVFNFKHQSSKFLKQLFTILHHIQWKKCIKYRVSNNWISVANVIIPASKLTSSIMKYMTMWHTNQKSVSEWKIRIIVPLLICRWIWDSFHITDWKHCIYVQMCISKTW